MSEEYTAAQVSEHNTKKDIFIIVHDKVYNASSFVDEHPGGEEVLLDVGGQDATEAFEDVGHSDEAREILEGMLVGKLKRAEGEKAKTAGTNKISAGPAKSTGGAGADSGMGIVLYVLLLVGGLAAYLAYGFVQKK